MLNTAHITGRITKTPKSRVSDNGVLTVYVNLACDRNVARDANGNRPTDYFLFKFFGDLAGTVAEYAEQGQLVTVTATMRSRRDTIGKETVFTTEFIGNNIDLLTKKKATDTDADTDDNGGDESPEPAYADAAPGGREPLAA